MSSIIKSGHIKQGSIINLQERIQPTYINEPELIQDDSNEDVQAIELEPKINYNELLETALKQKEDILIQAKQEAEEIIARSYEKIRDTEEQEVKRIEQMCQEAKEQAEGIIQDAKEKEQQIIESAYSEKRKILEQVAPEVTEVIKMLVSHILYEEVAKGNQWISYVVKKMILKEELLGDLVVYLSPSVLERITPEEYKEFESIKNQITLEADESLNDMTCMVETAEGSILYDLSEGIDKIIKDLTALKQLTIEAVYD